MKVQYLIDDLINEKAVQYLRTAVPEFFKKNKNIQEVEHNIDKTNQRDPKTNAYIQTWSYFNKKRGEALGQWVDFIQFQLSEERIEAHEHPFNTEFYEGLDIEIKSKLIITYLIKTK
jgi:Zn-dependent M32 family carboxypeptidase